MRFDRFPSYLLHILITAASMIAPLAAAATGSSSGVTYQGRILKPDGSPLSGVNTQFKLQLRTPDAQNCLMYEEVQSLNMSTSNGVFSITINDGSGSRTDSTTLTLDRIFANHGSFAFDPATCNSGTGAYAPNPSDGRNLVVLFKDETMGTWEPIPSQKINYIPFAFEAKQVAGFTADSLLRVIGASGDPLTGLAPLSNAQYTELIAVLGGTSAQYTKSGQLGGSAIPATSSLTAGQVLSWTGSAWTASDPSSSVQSFAKVALPTCSAGQFFKDNGTNGFVCATPAASGGTVTQVNTGTGLTGGGFTTSGTISIATAGVTTSLLADGNVTLAKLAANSVDSSKIVDGSITGADLSSSLNVTTSGNIVSGGLSANTFNDYSPVNTNNTQLSVPNGGTAYVMTLPSAQGTTGQVMSLDASGKFQWTSPGSYSQWTTHGSNISFDGAGNVGIGTTSPTSTLFVNGSLTAGNANFQNILTVGNYGAGINYNGTNVFAVTGNPTNGGGYVMQVTGGAPTTSAYIMKYMNNNGVIGSTDLAGNMYVAGNVGIGTTAPGAKLQVNGSIIVGDGGETCASPVYGAIRYNGGNLQYCGTSGWTTLGIAGSGITGLSGDVTATGTGTVAATVASVGGVTAVNVATGANAANAAVSTNTASKIVVRDGSGDFSARNVSVAQSVLRGSTSGTVTFQSPSAPTSYAMTLPPAVASSTGQVLTSDTSGVLSWTTPSSSLPPSGTAGGDLNGTYPNPGVLQVGGVTAANVASGANAANAAVSTSTASKIVVRDSSGNFAGNVITGNGLTLNNGSSLLNITNPIGGAWNMILPATAGSSGQVMTTNGSGTMSWTTPMSSTTAFVQGGNSYAATGVLGTNDANDLAVRTNGATRMTVTSGGNVGIGTTAPGGNLEVAGTAVVSGANPSIAMYGSSTANMTFRTLTAADNPPQMQFLKMGPSGLPSANQQLGLVVFNSSNSGYGNVPASQIGSSLEGTPSNSSMPALLHFDTVPSGTTTMTERMRITASGNIGVGTTAPQATLDIAGTARLAINSSQPAACTTVNSGTLALNSTFKMCVCKGPSAAWVYTSDGSTACSW